jgi:glyoxylase-like metal-dependent hydrolase (beta-lactamase superfamily II)
VLQVQHFTFNPFFENTYIVYDTETLACVIFDPGCYRASEEETLKKYIISKQLIPVALVNTHCHVDHILGNDFVARTWKLKLQLHEQEQITMQQTARWAEALGINPGVQEAERIFIDAGSIIKVGNYELIALFTPGHSIASLSFYCKEAAFVIGGDVLFKMGIGRTDLPGGDFETLAASIQHELYTLPHETIVYSGHGEPTTVGFEILHNPYVKGL